jgi:hypothetical protein
MFCPDDGEEVLLGVVEAIDAIELPFEPNAIETSRLETLDVSTERLF